ncbi:MAG: LPS assembly protein LptD [Amphritea sp.]|nr:LPS assembly protein LptD [Amphritea sp.]
MPFNRRSSYSLTLAILAAIPAFLNSQQVQAETATAEPEVLWSCTMVKGGEWDCSDKSSAPVTEPQPATPSGPAIESVTDAQSNAADSKTGSETSAAQPQPVSVEQPQSIAPVTPASGTAVTEEAVAIEAVATATAAPAPEITVTDQTAATVQTRAEGISGAWECQADSHGNWNCAKGRAPAPQQYAATATDVPTEPTGNSSDITRAPAAYDWYPVSLASGMACHGQYIEPDYQQDAEDDELRIDADRSETQLGGLTVFQGNVQLRQQGRYLRGDQAEIDQVSNRISMNGNIRYREPGLLLSGDHAQTNATSGETLISNASYVFHERSLRGDADQIIRLEDERVYLEQSTFTQCPPGDNSWHIASGEIELDPNKGFGTAKNATLQIADTPVLYFPYMTFPIDDRRLSGFLYPSFGYSDGAGFQLSTPYYFNLAPDYDDTLTPRYFSKRGLLLENEFRHLNNYGSQSLSTGILFDDDQTGKDRWLASIKHSGGTGPWSTSLDYNAVSDNNYFNDLGSSLEVNRQDHLNRRVSSNYQGDTWNANLTLHAYQTINAKTNGPYQRMPQFRLNGQDRFNYGAGNLELSYLIDATQFDRNLDGLTGINRVTGSRLHLQPSISMPMLWPWGHLTPKVSYWQSQYNLNDQIAGQDDSIDRSVGVFSLDSGLVFERITDNYTQTLEPRAFALFVPETAQQGIPDFDTSTTSFSYAGLFRENRFTGLDKLGDAQQLSLGLSSAFYQNNGGELARLSLGQAFYFDDRNVQLNGNTTIETANQSNYAAEAMWNPHSNLRVTVDSELSRTSLKRIESNFKVSYQPSLNKVISFNYRQRDEEREQTDLSFIWPVSPTWSVMGRWQKDLFNNQTPETLLGLEYQSCCWKFRVAARRWIKDDSNQTTDNAIYLQLILNGLGTLGSGDNALQDIIGFRERENYHDK